MIDPRKLSNFDRHKLIKPIIDQQNKPIGFIVIHNTNLGPAAGGTRMLPYKSVNEALNDALNLSRAMTYKCAVSNVRFGGGKGVIIGDPVKNKSLKLLKLYARTVDSLNGKFFTGEDVGINEEDVQYMLKFSPYFIGKSNLAGDPSPFAALSVYYSMKVAAKERFGWSSLNKKKVAIKGIGKVGYRLAELLYKEGTQIFVADINKLALKKLITKVPRINLVSPREIISLDVDIYSPCALGNEFTTDNIKRIKTKIICGSANNQLSSDKIDQWFHDHNILYIPDFVANAGGLINVIDELNRKGYKRIRVVRKINEIKKTVKKIIALSKKNNTPTGQIANKMAENIFNKKYGNK